MGWACRWRRERGRRWAADVGSSLRGGRGMRLVCDVVGEGAIGRLLWGAFGLGPTGIILGEGAVGGLLWGSCCVVDIMGRGAVRRLFLWGGPEGGAVGWACRRRRQGGC